MILRSREIVNHICRFYKTLPPELLTFPINIVAILNHLDYVKVYSYQEFAKFNNFTIQDVIKSCESETGCTHKRCDKYIIMFNDSLGIISARKTFTLAHELAHIILDHLHNSNRRLIAECADTVSSKPFIEQCADYGAAYLLCPTPILYEIKPQNIYDIKVNFGLSSQASQIAYERYLRYDRNYYLSNHNDIVRLFKPALKDIMRV